MAKRYSLHPNKESKAAGNFSKEELIKLISSGKVPQAWYVYDSDEKAWGVVADLHNQISGVSKSSTRINAKVPATTKRPQFAATSLQPGDELGQYSIVSELGKGGMAVVYLGIQKSLNRKVAIKVLSAHLCGEEKFRIRFDKEGAALAALQHPNIVGVIDRGVEKGHYYLVMEYIDGVSLRYAMSNGNNLEQLSNGKSALPVKTASDIVAQVLRGLDYAHQTGVIHRDIKPDNILIGTNGVAKIADFGLANLLAEEFDDTPQVTQENSRLGTLNYMSPEQKFDPHNVTAQSDIYSTGIMFYEMLTGTVPMGAFRPPSQINPGVGNELDRILTGMMESDLNHRPRSASEVANSLIASLSVATIEGGGSTSSSTEGGRAKTPVGLRKLQQAESTDRAEKPNLLSGSNILYGLIGVGLLTIIGIAFFVVRTAADTSEVVKKRFGTDIQKITQGSRPVVAQSASDENKRIAQSEDTAGTNVAPLSIPSKAELTVAATAEGKKTEEAEHSKPVQVEFRMGPDVWVKSKDIQTFMNSFMKDTGKIVFEPQAKTAAEPNRMMYPKKENERPDPKKGKSPFREKSTEERNEETDKSQKDDLDQIVECPCCKGAKRLECPCCDGDKKMTCFLCEGDGIIHRRAKTTAVTTVEALCHLCSKSGKLTCRACNGSGKVKCVLCDGKGQCKKSTADNFCHTCHGAGYVKCSEGCRWGHVICTQCDGKGENEAGVRCAVCSGRGVLPCPKCGRNKPGLIECEKCNGTGKKQ